MNMSRSLQKAAVEMLLGVVVIVVGFLIEQPEIGIGATGLVVLEQVRRLARDYRNGAPN